MAIAVKMNRNFGLDLLRAISIWLVLLQHGGFNIPGLQSLKIGGIGVEIFFVLSGFLIGGILFKEIEKKNNLRSTLMNFWVRRWFRILPLYYLILAIKFFFIDDSVGWNILYYIFFLQNNFYGVGFLEVSWSLVIEEWFYLFSPIFLYFATKVLKSEKRIAYSIVGFILCVIAARTVYVYQGDVAYTGVNSNFPFRFDSLFIGVLLAFVKFKKWLLFEKLKSLKAFLLGMGLFVGYVYFFWTLSYPEFLIDTVYVPRTIGFFILPFTISLTIPYIATITLNPRYRIQKVCYWAITWTSLLTYAIYLIHPFVFESVLPETDLGIYAMRFSLAILITYVLSFAVYHWYEKPILKYRDRITGHKRDKKY